MEVMAMGRVVIDFEIKGSRKVINTLKMSKKANSMAMSLIGSTKGELTVEEVYNRIGVITSNSTRKLKFFGVPMYMWNEKIEISTMAETSDAYEVGVAIKKIYYAFKRLEVKPIVSK